MKASIFLAVLTLVLVPAITHAAFDTDLRYGSIGPKVYELQEFLTTQGVYTGPITGNFYSLTLQGVKNFQAVNGVQPVSGFFGPISRGVANTKLAIELEQSDVEASSTPPVIEPKDPAPRPAPDRNDSSNEDDSNSNNEPEPMPEAPAPELGTIKLTAPFDRDGLSKTYTVVTDPAIERWDQAPTESVAVIGIELRDSGGAPVNAGRKGINVHVDAGGQSRNMGGKDNFQYLFRKAGEVTITFTADGFESESVTLRAE